MTLQNGWVNKAGRSYLDRFVGGGFNFDFSVVLLLLSDEASLFVSSIFSDFTVSIWFCSLGIICKNYSQTWLTHCLLGNFSCFFVVCWFFSKLFFWKKSFRNTIRMSNSMDPDQARRFVGPDLGPNCLPRLSADVTGRQRVETSSRNTIKHDLVTT